MKLFITYLTVIYGIRDSLLDLILLKGTFQEDDGDSHIKLSTRLRYSFVLYKGLQGYNEAH